MHNASAHTGDDRNFICDLKDAGLYLAEVPHQLFARLRREQPVYWNPEADGAGFWAVTRYDDILEVSRQPGLFSSAHENGGHRIFNENEVSVANSGESLIGTPFISLDPPEHVHYRATIVPGLTAAKLADMEVRIRQRASDLLDRIPLGETVDFVQAFAAPLPLLTLAELLGLGPDMWQSLYHWTNAFIGEDDPEFRRSPEEMAQVMGAFMAWAQSLYDARRATPTDDIASMMANAVVRGRPMGLADFLGNMILVLVGGNETTRNSISHSVLAFAQAPDQWQALRQSPELARTAVREMVRHASPVMHMRRTATADTSLRGVPIRKGDKVVLWYVSANRDEAVFPDADRFDIRRGEIKHVGFGTGQHVCVGSRLAEMQLRIAFGLLAERVERFEVQAAPRRFRSNFINGLKNLDVKLVPARRGQ
ncbi:cytochrome P450 [Oleomonas cavernae]|uniref:Cytochrome P450 n=1 Tax=Oleomonas cavernae TaxID=2320859 RepID=A0A418WFM4_9PROT|nr:cytochrome P450 [Oleomonas cavernae]RJF88818.1 cytochrome P450 [Oleomonas cavernae]